MINDLEKRAMNNINSYRFVASIQDELF